MALGVGPVKQAFVRALREITALKAVIGSDGIHEGVALEETAYPFVTYSLVGAARERQFGNTGFLIATFNCWVWSDDQVEAHNLDQLILDGLDDAVLNFSGTVPAGDEPSTLLCRRMADMSLADVDDAGNKVYRVGGSYQVWTDRL